MLRPIDVIFKHPVKKFTVIYQNGKLWQLPRLEFDGNSLRHKRPYTGSREQIFVAQDQSLPADDLLLRSQLATLALPDTVAGKNADEFERWWQQNSYELREASERAKQQQAYAKALLANPNAQPPQTLPSIQPQAVQHASPTVTITPKVENNVPPQAVELPTVSTQIQPQNPPMQTAIPLPTVSTQPMPKDFVPPPPQAQIPPAPVPEPQPATKPTPQVKPVGLPPVPTTTTTDLSEFDDIFGDMMKDLTKGL